MFNNIAIEIALGLVFVYLLYSLLTTIISEIISRWMGLRQRMLLKSIARMLEDEKNFYSKNKRIRAVEQYGRKTTLSAFVYDFVINIRRYIYPFWSRPLTKTFYQKPGIKYLGENNWNSKPSYLKASTFSMTLIDMLRNGPFTGTEQQINMVRKTLTYNHLGIGPETLSHLKMLLADSNDDIEKFKESVEDWYNETQERTTGWYKKQAQLLSFLIGLLLSISFNINTFGIYQKLAHDRTARTNLLALIDQSMKRDSSGFRKGSAKDSLRTDSLFQLAERLTRNDISNATSILGLSYPIPEKYDVRKSDGSKWIFTFSTDSVKRDPVLKYLSKCTKDSSDYDVSFINKICYIRKYTAAHPNEHPFWGWFVTALAISLGAPFWFDLLNKLMMLRATVKNTEDNTEKSSSKTVSPKDRVG